MKGSQIETQVLTLEGGPGDDRKIDAAAAALREDRLVAFPTETVYGLGASADSPVAVDHLYEVKGRDRTKPCAVMVPGMSEARRLAGELSRPAAKLMRIYWPGPLTIVAGEGDAAVGLRLPADHTARALVSRAGVPVLAPSANLSGQAEATSAPEVIAQLGGMIDFVLDGGPCRGGQASTVVRVTGESVVVLREGPIATDEIAEASAPRALFVCRGNSCRSPMAAVIFSDLVSSVADHDPLRWQAGSAGTDEPSGPGAHEYACRAVAELGLDLTDHQPRSLTVDAIDKADLIFTMDGRQRELILDIVPDAGDRIDLLDPSGADIEDPAGSSFESYRLCRDKLLACLRRRVEDL